MQLRIRGTVTTAVCRTTRTGAPLVELSIAANDGQEVRAKHAYPDATPANHYAANSFAKRARGQLAEIDATNPKFRARRLDCDAQHITLPNEPALCRKDLE